MARLIAQRALAAALVAAVAAAVAGCGGSDRPAGVSADFQRQARDACARAVGTIGILDFTSIPGPPALTRVSRTLRDSAAAIGRASASTNVDQQVQARLAAGFEKAAAAVDDYVMGARASEPDDQRYSRMIAALGDMGSEGQRAGTDACVVPNEG